MKKLCSPHVLIRMQFISHFLCQLETFLEFFHVIFMEMFINVQESDETYWQHRNFQRWLIMRQNLNIWVTFEVKIEYDLSGSKRVMESYQTTHLYPPYTSVNMSHIHSFFHTIYVNHFHTPQLLDCLKSLFILIIFYR